MEKKLACVEKERVQMELLRKVLEDKEKEISDAKNQLRQAKEKAVREYRDSDALLSELGDSLAEGFDDALRQVKSSYPDLDVSHVSIETQAQSTAQPILSEGMKELFTEDVGDANAVNQGDGDVAPGVQEKDVEESTYRLEDGHVVDEDDNQQYIYIYIYIFFVELFGEQLVSSSIRCLLYLNISPLRVSMNV